ncbi:MAG: cell division protein FtsW [Candidatus Pacebacteria bacterium]|jgi:cell division protein FtsW|nr:cell division protein FtsW [Candidatus Paceibacterota bacterium]
MRESRGGDRFFLILVITILVLGVLVFISSSLGVYAENPGKFWKLLLSHIGFGVGGGFLLWGIVAKLGKERLHTAALGIFIGTLILTICVFIPGIGATYNGATRWIDLGPFSLQPSEFLKIASILVYASWLAHAKKRVTEFKYGLLPLFIILGLVGIVMLLQPDTDSFMIIGAALGALYFLAGGPWKHILIIGLIGIIGAGSIIAMRPYILDRFKTFLDPSADPLGSSYQIQQSMIALGSGGLTGRGLGQSVQKFRYLPEATNDSIFAVYGEETGFVGTIFLILLYVAFLFRGIRIASRMPDTFGTLTVSGIMILLAAQSFLNMASTVGIFPLSGLPLVFVSQGGTAMLIALGSVGIVFSFSKSMKS